VCSTQQQVQGEGNFEGSKTLTNALVGTAAKGHPGVAVTAMFFAGLQKGASVSCGPHNPAAHHW
jgi:hypothetical protein